MLNTEAIQPMISCSPPAAAHTGECAFVDIQSSTAGATVDCVLSVLQYRATDVWTGERASMFHPNELAYVGGNINQRRKQEYLAGRYAAKSAASRLLNEPDLSTIEIARGVFNQPIVKHPSAHGVEVSISHKRSLAVALAFEAGQCMAIDIEERSDHAIRVMESQLSETEKLTLRTSCMDYKAACGQLWSVKEALSKALKTGLTATFEMYETEHLVCNNGILTNCCFKHFYQYTAKTWVFDTYILAIVFPRNASLDLNTHQFRAHIESRA